MDETTLAHLAPLWRVDDNHYVAPAEVARISVEDLREVQHNPGDTPWRITMHLARGSRIEWRRATEDEGRALAKDLAAARERAVDYFRVRVLGRGR